MKKLRFSKPKKIKKSVLKKKCDVLFSKLVRSKGFCELKGLDHVRCGGPLQTMHIIGRSNLRLHWDLMNALCGCAGHHIFYTYHPIDFFMLLRTSFYEKYKYIMQHRHELLTETFTEVYNRLKLS